MSREVEQVRKALNRVRDELTEQESIVEDQDAALIRLTGKNMAYNRALRDIKAICSVSLMRVPGQDELLDILEVIDAVEWTR